MLKVRFGENLQVVIAVSELKKEKWSKMAEQLPE